MDTQRDAQSSTVEHKQPTWKIGKGPEESPHPKRLSRGEMGHPEVINISRQGMRVRPPGSSTCPRVTGLETKAELCLTAHAEPLCSGGKQEDYELEVSLRSGRGGGRVATLTMLMGV